MANSLNGYAQVLWAVFYAVWLIALKPASSTLFVASQAVLAQLAGLTALFLFWADAPLAGLILLGGVICYISARHFFDNFDEPYARLLSFLWAYFGAAMIWILGHWLLFYGVIAQPTLILSLVGYGLGVLYYFDHRDQLSTHLRRYTIFTIIAALAVVIIMTWVLGGWGNKVV